MINLVHYRIKIKFSEIILNHNGGRRVPDCPQIERNTRDLTPIPRLFVSLESQLKRTSVKLGDHLVEYVLCLVCITLPVNTQDRSWIQP